MLRLSPEVGHGPCECVAKRHRARLVAIAGGPGEGKTALLELARNTFCEHVIVLPAGASVVLAGGFPRRASGAGRRALQRAVYHVQRELERLVIEEARAAVVLCEKGTLDGLAYWPGTESSFWKEIGTTREAELGRYAAVVHLSGRALPCRRDPRRGAIAARLADAWRGHPRELRIEGSGAFLQGATAALRAVRELMPACCLAPPFGEARALSSG